MTTGICGVCEPLMVPMTLRSCLFLAFFAALSSRCPSELGVGRNVSLIGLCTTTLALQSAAALLPVVFFSTSKIILS